MAETINLGIVGIKNMGEYNSQTKYEKLNVVTYQGSSYCALKDTTGNLPTNTEYWQLYAEKGGVGPQGPKPVKGVDYYTEEDKAEIEINLKADVHSEVSSQIGNLESITPLAVDSISDMTDTSRIYVNTTNGYWYYYDGTEWVQGGIYQSTGISGNDPVIIHIDKNLEILNSFFTLIAGKNKFDGLTRVGGYNTSTGEYDESNTSVSCNTNPVKVDANTTYYVSDNGSAKNVQIFLYKEDGSFIEWIGAANYFTTPANCGFVNFYAGSLSDKIMISKSSDLTYEEFDAVYLLNKNPDNNVLSYISENIAEMVLENCFDYEAQKNKFDGLTRVGGYNTSTGEYDESNTSVSCNTNPVKVKENTKYYVSDNGSAKNAVIFYYRSDGTYISYSGGTNNFTTPANCGFVNFYAGTLSNKIMISDSSDLTYEEYNREYYLKKKPNENILDYIANNIPRTSKSNYKILNIGDSLWGNYEGDSSLSGIIHNLTGATTYNCGFGGCRMTQRPNDGGWNAFSMCNLADSIAAGDFTMQDDAISVGFIGMPDYFPSHLNTLKSIDFSEIDILTIGFGVNDYMGGKYVENTNNKYDKNYINGALRYSIETIQTAYPNLCIVVVSPNFAVWFQNGQVWKTSDEPYYNASTGVTLPDVVNGEETVAREYKCKFINVYFNSGNNRFTALNNFNTTDGVHPNENGRLKMGTYIANNLLDQ